VIVSDQRMPGMNGGIFSKNSRSSSAMLRILLTGYATHPAIEAITGAEPAATSPSLEGRGTGADHQGGLAALLPHQGK